MNNSGKKKSGAAWIWVIIGLLCALSGAADGSVACVVIISAVIVMAIVALAERAKKKAAANPEMMKKFAGSPQAAANRPAANPYGAAKKPTANADAAARRMAAHEVNTPLHPNEDAESAPIRYTCSRGKQRYLDQAAMFYKNGFIDKAEYKYMCERYNKLDIPEDF